MISYREQQEILHDTYAKIGKKTELLLLTGQLLMENGADTIRIIRDMNRVAAYMGIKKEQFNLHIMYTTIMINISDEEHSYTYCESTHRLRGGGFLLLRDCLAKSS